MKCLRVRFSLKLVMVLIYSTVFVLVQITSKLRICKRIIAAFIYFAFKQGMKDLPRGANDFHDTVISYMEKYPRSMNLDEYTITSGVPCRSTN